MSCPVNCPAGCLVEFTVVALRRLPVIWRTKITKHKGKTVDA